MPEYTKDNFTSKIKNFERHLHHRRGKESLALEIGSYEGRSAIWMCENILTHPKSTLECVDPFINEDGRSMEAVKSQFNRNIDKLVLEGKLIWHNQDSESFLRYAARVRTLYDFIYVDGNHKAKFVLSDAVMSWPVLKPGGIIIFDDYKKPSAGVADAVCAFLECFGSELEVLNKGYQITLRKNK